MKNLFNKLAGLFIGAVIICTPIYSQAADVNKALVVVFGHEGGYTADKHDPGNWTGGVAGKGVLKGTKFGIAAASYPKVDIKHLTITKAAVIYNQCYWKPLHLDKLKSQAVATILFDAACNMGTGTEARILQQAVNMTNYPRPDIIVNGVIDDMTINNVNQHLNRKALFSALCGLQFDRYKTIVEKNKNMERYLTSWLARIGDYGQDTTPVLIAKLHKRGYTVTLKKK